MAHSAKVVLLVLTLSYGLELGLLDSPHINGWILGYPVPIVEPLGRMRPVGWIRFSWQ